MADLFSEKAKDWDVNDMVVQLSNATSKAILDNIDFKPGMKVMDFGAGTGLITGKVMPHVSGIVAVDVSEAMLEQLSNKEEFKDKVTPVCQNIIEKPLDKKFDVIMSAMAMHHVEDTDELFKTFYEHLTPDGKVALVDLDMEDGTFHPPEVEGVYHDGFERRHIQNLLEKNGFTDIKFVTAHTVDKQEKSYPIFLVTASRH